jgi:AmmeMemoRadiSam system protein A
MESLILKLAKKTIENFINSGKIIQPPKPLPKELSKKAGVFVSIHLKTGELRGCIGTFLPTQKNLAQEIIQNAVAASSQDPRFSPITKEELNNLEISVDVLSTPIQIKDIKELDAKKFGVIVKSSDGKTGLLLPDLEGVKTVSQQIQIASQKAGISPDEKIIIYKFSVQRFKE